MNMQLIWLLMTQVSIWNFINAEKIFLKDENGFDQLSKSWYREAGKDTSCVNSWEDKKKNNSIVWETCYAAVSTNQDCYLKSNFFNLNGINVFFVSIELITSRCIDFKSKEKLKPKVLNCFETLELAIYTGPKIFSIAPAQYKSSIIPAVSKKIQEDDEFYTTNDIISVSDFNNADVLQIAFRTRNYCGILVDVRVFYYVCPSTTAELVNFPSVASPSDKNSPKRIEGECKNGYFENGFKSYMECYSNGSYRVYGKCICKEGFEPKDFSCIG